MRIRRGRGALLLVATLAASPATAQLSDTKTKVVFRQFDGDAIGNKAFAIFTSNSDKSFAFDAANGVTIDSVTLRKGPLKDGAGEGDKVASTPDGGSDDNSANPSPTTPTSTTRIVPTTVPEKKRSALEIESALMSESNAILDQQVVDMTLADLRSGNSDTFARRITISSANLGVIRNQVLYFDVSWSEDGRSGGHSFSRYLAFTSDAQEATSFGLMTPTNQSLLASSNLAADEIPPSDAASSAGGGGGGGGSNGGGVNPSSTDASSSSNPTNSALATLGAVSGSSGPGGSLATGAIAGIAVAGAVVGLALIGLLVFFLLRRRKQQRATLADGGVGYANGRPSHRRTADLMAEKEATAGVGETPHSPYSEDGVGVGAGGVGGAAGAGAAEPLRSELERGEREFSPYRDAAPSTHSHGHGADAPPDASRGVAPPDASTDGADASMSGAGLGAARYAHLIEEGMTPQDIADLEAEERHLDAAIQRAGASGH